MKCPNCEETLVMTERQGVEIDYCPKCRGVWLDKGELDKIIERTADYNGPDTPSLQQPPPPQGYQGGQGYYG
ncbi:MAG TPA: zf-TFIIB domain-containing protein, partial [Flavisolibacter sp.]|nr:zf-TFIIB domain-containing protein [Flavisolibacter sp.]